MKIRKFALKSGGDYYLVEDTTDPVVALTKVREEIGFCKVKTEWEVFCTEVGCRVVVRERK